MSIWLISIPIVFVLLALLLKVRKRRAQEREEVEQKARIDSLKPRLEAAVENWADEPVVLKLLECAGYFLKLSVKSEDCGHRSRSYLHSNLVSCILVWADAAASEREADTPHRSYSARFVLALMHLRMYQFAFAEELLSAIWTDDKSHVKARKLALMAQIWSFASQGLHELAAEHEFLLLSFEGVGRMDDLEITGYTAAGI